MAKEKKVAYLDVAMARFNRNYFLKNNRQKDEGSKFINIDRVPYFYILSTKKTLQLKKLQIWYLLLFLDTLSPLWSHHF